MTTLFTRAKLFCGMALCLTSCMVPTTIPEVACDPDLQGMLLDETSMPEDWSTGQASADDEYGRTQIAYCVVPFSVVNGRAFEEIYQYPDEIKAQQDYAYFIDVFAWDNPRSLPTPEIESSVADAFYLICGVPGATPMCKILARYGEFVVHFNTHLSPDFMTDSDLEAIVKAIDEKMSSALSDGD